MLSPYLAPPPTLFSPSCMGSAGYTERRKTQRPARVVEITAMPEVGGGGEPNKRNRMLFQYYILYDLKGE
jgi:hypothetical protein